MGGLVAVFLLAFLWKNRHRFSIIGELFTFFWENKLWWMIPMVSVILLFGILMIFAQSSAVAPFIYTLF
ncbi:MAG: hypothetical protein HYT87_11020 [Nitrospirae bacterium]|nr:hypothetical protein [Nitrospirota bacterium]